MISRRGYDTQKNQLNALISAGWTSFAGGYCNLAGVPQIGADGAYANTTYFNADGVNLTDAGYVLVAQAVQPVVNGMIAGATTGFTNINAVAAALIFGG
jgi:lysophospholipase L1-like esterase